VGIAANASSGVGKGRARVARLVRALETRGLETRVAWTVAERGELVEAANADADCRCLVAAGGDGTVAALVNERPQVPVTTLPAGTENLFASHFGIRRDPERVAEMIASGRARSIDLGFASGRLFTLMAGLGFDADVVSRHHSARVGPGGRLRTTHRAAYVEPVLRSSLVYPFPTLEIEAETEHGPERLTGTTAIFFNLPRYALRLRFAPAAPEDDGLLDLVVFRNPGPFQALRYLWLVFRGLHLRRPGVYHRRVARASVTADANVPVQLDGDPGGSLLLAGGQPWTVSVVPRALDVLAPVPRTARIPT
jgi:diacylglycerol kinase family enzyme